MLMFLQPPISLSEPSALRKRMLPRTFEMAMLLKCNPQLWNVLTLDMITTVAVPAVPTPAIIPDLVVHEESDLDDDVVLPVSENAPEGCQ